MHDHTKLDVWRLTRRFVVEVYEATACFPAEELYGLTSQLRRAAVSVAANLAEGAGRGSPRDFARFVRYSGGSVAECVALLTLATDLHLLSEETRAGLAATATRITNMLKRLDEALTRPTAREAGSIPG